ncbi:hypothetical protein Lal_00032328 [Lupinus albus]|nr:hypothetical protein Lal_00032328 [Lupinus albus]
MGSSNPFGGDGSSINRPPIFSGEGPTTSKSKEDKDDDESDSDLDDETMNLLFANLANSSKEKEDSRSFRRKKRKSQPTKARTTKIASLAMSVEKPDI